MTVKWGLNGTESGILLKACAKRRELANMRLGTAQRPTVNGHE
jgi:hypothetical protein